MFSGFCFAMDCGCGGGGGGDDDGSSVGVICMGSGVGPWLFGVIL